MRTSSNEINMAISVSLYNLKLLFALVKLRQNQSLICLGFKISSQAKTFDVTQLLKLSLKPFIWTLCKIDL